MVLKRLAEDAGLTIHVDSAGTGGWHIGDPPDARMQTAGAAQGYDLSGLRARQVSAADFDRFDLILAMDRQNRADLERLRPAGNTVPVRLMLSWGAAPSDQHSPAEQDVPDPYFTRDFEQALDLIEEGARAWTAQLHIASAVSPKLR